MNNLLLLEQIIDIIWLWPCLAVCNSACLCTCVRAGRRETALCSGRRSRGAGCVPWRSLQYHLSPLGWRRSAELLRPLQRIPAQRLGRLVSTCVRAHTKPDTLLCNCFLSISCIKVFYAQFPSWCSAVLSLVEDATPTQEDLFIFY